MSDDATRTPDENGDRLSEIAGRKQRGLLGELFGLLRHTKKWWLTPIILVIVVLGLIVFLSVTPVAPFIYTLF